MRETHRRPGTSHTGVQRLREVLDGRAQEKSPTPAGMRFVSKSGAEEVDRNVRLVSLQKADSHPQIT